MDELKYEKHAILAIKASLVVEELAVSIVAIQLVLENLLSLIYQHNVPFAIATFFEMFLNSSSSPNCDIFHSKFTCIAIPSRASSWRWKKSPLTSQKPTTVRCYSLRRNRGKKRENTRTKLSYPNEMSKSRGAVIFKYFIH